MRKVKRVVEGMATQDGAGVKLKRLIGGPALSDVDPFLLFDEFRSDTPGDYLSGFPNHPHRGFQTVTYMIAGRMRHGDNKGHQGVIGPGGVQWMHAGKGIVHSEMPEQQDGLLWGFQLWVNVSRENKLTPSRYQEFAAEAIPVVPLGGRGSAVKVIAGSIADGTTGPVADVEGSPLYLDYRLAPGDDVVVPLGARESVLLYVFEGTVQIGGGAGQEVVTAGSLAVLEDGGGDVVVSASSDAASFLVIAARPLRQLVARYGPFVMNTSEEIAQAITDYRAGRF